MNALRQVMGGGPPVPDRVKRSMEMRLDEAERRLARIDAGLPPIRARSEQMFPHPNRRAGDRT